MSSATRLFLTTVTLSFLAPLPAQMALANGAAVQAAIPPPSVTLLDGVPAMPGPIPFGDGEMLKFTAQYLGMSMGDAVMTVDTSSTHEGRPAIHYKSGTATGGMFSRFVYAFKGTGESWVDPTGLYSLGFVTDQSQRGMQDVQEWDFDYDRGVAVRDRARTKVAGATRANTKEYTLSKIHVQDSMSMIYFIRAFPLAVGTKIETEVFESKKVWKLTATVVGKEKIKVRAGTFHTLKIRPEVSLNGKKQEKGQLVIWMTDDDRKLPVRIDAESGYGAVTAELVQFKEGTKP